MSVTVVIDRPTTNSNWEPELEPTRSITTLLNPPKKTDAKLVTFMIVFITVAVVAVVAGTWYTYVFWNDWVTTGGKTYTNGKFMYCCTIGIFIPLLVILISAYLYYLYVKKAATHVEVQAKNEK
jgi:Na+/H+-translocating membrane pyrophosphatase